MFISRIRKILIIVLLTIELYPILSKRVVNAVRKLSFLGNKILIKFSFLRFLKEKFFLSFIFNCPISNLKENHQTWHFDSFIIFHINVKFKVMLFLQLSGWSLIYLIFNVLYFISIFNLIKIYIFVFTFLCYILLASLFRYW